MISNTIIHTEKRTITYAEMFILNIKTNNEQKRTKKPKNGVQYEHIEHNVHSGHPGNSSFYYKLEIRKKQD